MSDFLRKYWFVCLVALIIIGGLVYYIIDLNKDNVSKKTSDGVDVVTSTSLGDTTSEGIFDKYQNFNQSLLYHMYEVAVVDQSVETSQTMKNEAKIMANNIKSNMYADTTGKTKYNILSELAGFGFNGEDSLEEYCLTVLKKQVINTEYILEHYDELKQYLTKDPRVVSLIKINIPNPNTLTEEAQTKKDGVDQALKNGDSFESAAVSFSDDASVADKGHYGYIDSSNTDLDQELVKVATSMKKGEVSDWITVHFDKDDTYALYKIKIDEDDPYAMLTSEDDDIVNGIVTTFTQSDSDLEEAIIQSYAKDLNIQFENEYVKTQIANYLENKKEEGHNH